MVQTLLCGRGVSAHSIVAAHSSQSVRYVMDGPNADPPRTLKRDAPELREAYLKGKAWGPMAHDDGNAVAVVAWTNQICWAHFNLEFTGTKWALVEIGGGCD